MEDLVVGKVSFVAMREDFGKAQTALLRQPEDRHAVSAALCDERDIAPFGGQTKTH